jgi:hypothetical protein
MTSVPDTSEDLDYAYEYICTEARSRVTKLQISDLPVNLYSLFDIDEVNIGGKSNTHRIWIQEIRSAVKDQLDLYVDSKFKIRERQ